MAGWIESELITRVDQLVQADDSQLKDKYSVIRSYALGAVERYSRDYPNFFQWVRMGDGTSRYDFPSDFQKDFSSVISVERPTDAVPPATLTKKQFQVYPNDYTTYQLLFLESAVPTTTEFAVVFTTRQTLATVPDSHREAFAALVSASLCDTVAASLANDQDSTINAVSVDNTTSSSSWTEKGRAFWRQYASVVLPRKNENTKAAEVITNVNSPFAEVSTRVFRKR